MKRLALLTSLFFLVGCNEQSPSFTKPPPSLTGQPSWFSLGGEVYQENDVAEVENRVLAFKPQPRWFLGFSQPASTQEVDAYLGQLRRAGAEIEMREPQRFLPYRPPYPKTLYDLPLDDRGVRLSFDAAATDDPAVLQFCLTLTSRHLPVWRGVEHRWTNVLPFLFGFYVDGKAVAFPSNVSTKWGGIKSVGLLVASGGSRNWRLHVNEGSMRRFLPDSKPHVLNIVCAFSECQHEWWLGDGQNNFFEMGMPPKDHIGAQVLVRTNVIQLEWTGTRWNVARCGSPSPDRRERTKDSLYEITDM
jgi:hypothetical protein